MKRICLSIIAALQLTFTLTAQQPISQEQAKEIAASFFPKAKGGQQLEQTLAFVEKDSLSSQPCYYVFNRGNDQGFIIISADARARKVLAYADKGSFNAEDLPLSMRDMLHLYKISSQELAITPDSLLKMDLSKLNMSKSKARSSQSFAASVAPLLGNINYNQYGPYNDLCPVISGKHCVTGCTPVAGAQVVRYYGYPEKGTGKTYSYELDNQTYTETYDKEYNWDVIADSYNGKESEESRHYIAQLLYQMGRAGNVRYALSGSGAYTSIMAVNMVSLFGYDTGIYEFSRGIMKPSEFIYYLKKELNAKRPVVMAGYDEGGGGHAFVCDGYDANGLYHMNWGWGGLHNGYYDINNIMISGERCFNMNMTFVGGICPLKDDSRIMDMVYVDSLVVPSKVDRGAAFSVTAIKPQNLSLFKIDGSIGLAVYKNGRFHSLLTSVDYNLDPGYYYYSKDFNNIQIPSALAAGKYAIAVVFRSKSDDTWHACFSKNGSSNYYDMDLTASQVSFSINKQQSIIDIDESPIEVTPQNNNTDNGNVVPGEENTTVEIEEPSKPEVLQADVCATSEADIAIDEDGQLLFTLNLKNQGKADYQGKVGCYIYKGEKMQFVTTLKVQSLSLAAGASRSMTLSGASELEAGDYSIWAFLTDDEDQWQQLTPKNLSGCEFSITADEPEQEEQVNEEPSNEEPVQEEAALVNTSIKMTTAELSSENTYTASSDELQTLEFTLENRDDEMLSTVLYLTVFDSEGSYATDLMERRVRLRGKASRSFSVELDLSDLQPGSYLVMLTDQTEGEILPLTDGTSLFNLEVK